MRRGLVAGLAGGGAALAALVLPGPVSAGDPTDPIEPTDPPAAVLFAKLAPEETRPGYTITAWSSDPCASEDGVVGERLDWGIFMVPEPGSPGDGLPLEKGSFDELEADGSWRFRFVVPLEHHDYTIDITCVLPAVDGKAPVTRAYEPLLFIVSDDPGPDMTTIPRPSDPGTGDPPVTPSTLLDEVPTPPAAVPVVGRRPNFAG